MVKNCEECEHAKRILKILGKKATEIYEITFECPNCEFKKEVKDNVLAK